MKKMGYKSTISDEDILKAKEILDNLPAGPMTIGGKSIVILDKIQLQNEELIDYFLGMDFVILEKKEL